MSTSRKQLGRLIRQAREAKGLTIREAAKRLDDMDPSYLHKIELGQNPLGKHARKVAKLLGLDAAELEAMAAGNLPNYAPYLRAKFNLPPEAIAELEGHFAEVAAEYKRRSERSKP